MIFEVILISGKMGSGKSTLAAEIRKKVLQEGPGWGAFEVIFAGTIYEIHDKCREIVKKYGVAVDPKKDGALLQFLGTDWGRKVFGENVWVDIVKNKINQYRLTAKEQKLKGFIIVVPDLRFKNEMHVWEDSLKVRLECPKFERQQRCTSWRENDKHQSEVDLDDCLDQFDMIFDTDKVSAEDIATLVLSEIGILTPVPSPVSQ